MGTLSSWLWPAAQAACYHLLDALIHLQSALRSLTSLCSLAAARLAAAAPALRPVLAALFSLPPRDHIGSLPQRPITLGVAIAEEVADADWPAAVEALGRLLAWAHGGGFQTVLLYEPAGRLQQPHRQRQLELQLLLQRLNGVVRLQAGWRPSQPQVEWERGGLTAVLLAAADGQWPLLAVAVADDAAGRLGQHPQQADQTGEAARQAAIGAAIEAPARLRQRLQAAAGPLAGAEPDFVLVTGPALTLAGFPAWAVRTSEIYGVGPLAAVTPDRLQAALQRFTATKQRFGK